MTDKEFFSAISGVEDTELTGDELIDCGNCMVRIPKEILQDAGDYIFLNEYTCENCNEPY
jgi:MinD superfamily P-loop ATPase